MITVRPIVPGDVEPLARHVKPTPLLHETRAQLQRDGRAVYLVAVEDATPLGHVLLRLPPLDAPKHPRIDDVPQIEDLLVATHHRSRGVGTLLLEELEREAQRHGHARVSLSVGTTNAEAQRLYERRGYEDAGLGEFLVPGAAGGGKSDLCRSLVKDL